MWREWSDDDDDDSGILLWCRGWNEDQESLVVALYRLGFANTMGDAWRLVETVTVTHGYVCIDQQMPDDRIIWECDDGTQPATFVRIS